MRLTANSELAIRANNEGNWIQLGMDAIGVGSWSFSDTTRTRPIPSVRALLAVQLLTVRDVNCGFTIDDNQITGPLMFMRSGNVFGVEIRPEGSVNGATIIEVAGPARIGLTNAEGGARSFRFDMTATSVTYITLVI